MYSYTQSVFHFTQSSRKVDISLKRMRFWFTENKNKNKYVSPGACVNSVMPIFSIG